MAPVPPSFSFSFDEERTSLKATKNQPPQPAATFDLIGLSKAEALALCYCLSKNANYSTTRSTYAAFNALKIQLGKDYDVFKEARAKEDQKALPKVSAAGPGHPAFSQYWYTI
jgi:hypothetical protein